MQRILLAVAVAMTLLAGSQRPAWAQRRRPYNPYRDRPVTSPYLNLFRGDTDPGFNYHRLVRPELDFRSAQSRQQQSLMQLEGRFDAAVQAFDEADSGITLGGTGHPSYYMNYFGYYQFRPSQSRDRSAARDIRRPRAGRTRIPRAGRNRR